MRFINALAPYLPLFTSILLGSVERVTEAGIHGSHYMDNHFTEGATERWMGVVKNDIAQGSTSDMATFIEQMYKSTMGRHRLLLSSLSSVNYLQLPVSEPRSSCLPLSFDEIDLDFEVLSSPQSKPLLATTAILEEQSHLSQNIFESLRQFAPLEDFARASKVCTFEITCLRVF